MLFIFTLSFEQFIILNTHTLNLKYHYTDLTLGH